MMEKMDMETWGLWTNKPALLWMENPHNNNNHNDNNNNINDNRLFNYHNFMVIKIFKK